MAKILLDTSIIIDFLRRKDKGKTLLFSLSKNDDSLYISIITHTELYAGKSIWENQKAQEELEALFSGIDMLPLETEISKKAGEIKAKYNLNLLDAIIAATAITHNLSLATLNLKDFQKVRAVNLFKEES